MTDAALRERVEWQGQGRARRARGARLEPEAAQARVDDRAPAVDGVGGLDAAADSAGGLDAAARSELEADSGGGLDATPGAVRFDPRLTSRTAERAWPRRHGLGGVRRRGDKGVSPRLLIGSLGPSRAAALQWRDVRVPFLGSLRATAWLPTTLLAASLVALVYLLQTSGIATTGYDIQRLQAERDDWRLRNEQLDLELAKRRSLTWVEAEATGRLGMVRPAATALVYVGTGSNAHAAANSASMQVPANAASAQAGGQAAAAPTAQATPHAPAATPSAGPATTRPAAASQAATSGGQQAGRGGASR